MKKCHTHTHTHTQTHTHIDTHTHTHTHTQALMGALDVYRLALVLTAASLDVRSVDSSEPTAGDTTLTTVHWRCSTQAAQWVDRTVNIVTKQAPLHTPLHIPNIPMHVRNAHDQEGQQQHRRLLATPEHREHERVRAPACVHVLKHPPRSHDIFPSRICDHC